MIFASKTRVAAKSAYNDKVYQTKIGDIVKNATLDPATSGMDAAILCPDDFKGINKSLLENLSSAHPKTVLIYLYTNDKDIRDIPSNFKTYKVRKIDADAVRAAVEEYLQMDDVGDNITRTLTSVDNKADTNNEPVKRRTGLFGIGSKKKEEVISSRDENIKKSKERQSKMMKDALAKGEAVSTPKSNTKNERGKIRFNRNGDDSANDSTMSINTEEVTRVLGQEQQEDVTVTESREVILDNDNNDGDNATTVADSNVTENTSQKTEEVLPEVNKVTGVMSMPEEDVNIRNTVSQEERLAKSAERFDIDSLSKELELETISSNLLIEKSEYAKIEDDLKILDMEMLRVTRDTSLSAEDILLKIRQLAREKTGKMEKRNAMIANKLRSIINTVVDATERSSRAQIEETKSALEVLKGTNKSILTKVEEIDRITKKRIDMQIVIQETVSNIVTIYANLNKAATEVRGSMVDGTPTSSPLINNLLATSAELYTPENIADLWAQICKDLQEGRLTLSAVEKDLRALIVTMGELFNQDTEIIKQREQLTDLLRAKNVEQIIVPKSTLQTAVRVFIGARNTGVTSTALTLSGIASMSNSNVLLMDMRNKPKIGNYIDTISILELFEQREPKHLCGVVGIPEFHLTEDAETKKELFDEFIGELEMSLNEYRYINILLDDTQLDLLNEIKDYVITVNFITDSTPDNIDTVRDLVKNFDCNNVAKKIVIIDPAIDPLDLFSQITDKNPVLYGLVVVPHIPSMKKCTLRKYKPYEDDTIVGIFREVFVC